jgi:O-antigen/teichoic acid export membrane protein
MRNTLFGIGGQFALRAAGFLFNILVIRSLGGESFGQYSIVLAWTGLFAVIGDLGITRYLAREIARDRNNVAELFWNTVALRFWLSILAAVVTVSTAVMFTDYSTEIILGVAIFTVGYLFQAVMTPITSVLTGHERMDSVSVLEVVMQVLFMILATIVLLLGLDFLWLIIVGVINLPLNMLLQYWMLRRNHITLPPFRVNRHLWRGLLKAGLPFALIQISLTFAFRFDTILLSANRPDQYVGWYIAAYNLVLTFVTLARTFSSSAMPSLAREHAVNPDSIRPWYIYSVKVIMFFALPMAVGGMVLADKIVVTLFGNDFLPAAIPLAILVWDLPFVTFDSLCGNLSTSMKLETYSSRIYGGLGIVNVILNLILTPLFGIIGASFATVLTDLTGSAQFYVFFRRQLGSGLGFRRLIRLAGCAAVMGVMVFLMRDWNLFVVILLGGLLYCALVWLSGALTPDERAYLFGLVPRLWNYGVRRSARLKMVR